MSRAHICEAVRQCLPGCGSKHLSPMTSGLPTNNEPRTYVLRETITDSCSRAELAWCMLQLRAFDIYAAQKQVALITELRVMSTRHHLCQPANMFVIPQLATFRNMSYTVLHREVLVAALADEEELTWKTKMAEVSPCASRCMMPSRWPEEV